MGSPHSNPRVNIQLLRAPLVDAFEERRNLIVGQKGSTGSNGDGTLVRDVHNLNLAQTRAIFGDDDLYWSIVNWRRAVNVENGGRLQPLDVISMDANGSGTAATATFVIAGTSTAAGTLTFSAVDGRDFTVNVAVASGATAASVATSLATALNGLTNAPFTAAASTGTVTLTASDVGTVGNFYGLSFSGAVAGLTVTSTAWTGGANDPTLTSILDPIDGRRYTGILWPEYWESSVNIVGDVLAARFNASNQIMDGTAFVGFSATAADARTRVGTLNNQSLVFGGNNEGTRGPVILQPAHWTMSYFMGVRDKRLTTNAQVADLITSTDGPLDATGGAALASKPYFNTPLPFVPVTSAADLYSSTQQIELEDDGFTTFGVNTAGNGMLMGPVVTTATTDSAGNANASFLHLNFVDTGSVCREIMFRTLKAAFAQSRLTQGDLIPGRSIENTESIRAEIMGIYRVLADQALTQAGDDAERFFGDNLVVEITGNNLSNRGVTINGPLPIVTQLGEVKYNLSLNFALDQTGTQITL